MVVGITGWQLNSLDLRTLAHNIESTEGWESFPGLRAAGTKWAFQHGEDLGGIRYYEARNIELGMMILDTPADGIITTTRQQHLDENIAALLGALHSSSAYLTLTKTLYPATARTIQVRPVEFFRIEDGIGGLSRSVHLSLRTGYPFWHGASFSVSAGAGSAVFNNLGNAPINDMIITFTGVGRITNEVNGDWVESDTAGVILNVGTGDITTGVPAQVSTNRAHYFQIEPGNNTFTRTGTIQVAGFYGYF